MKGVSRCMIEGDSRGKNSVALVDEIIEAAHSSYRHCQSYGGSDCKTEGILTGTTWTASERDNFGAYWTLSNKDAGGYWDSYFY